MSLPRHAWRAFVLRRVQFVSQRAEGWGDPHLPSGWGS